MERACKDITVWCFFWLFDVRLLQRSNDRWHFELGRPTSGKV